MLKSGYLSPMHMRFRSAYLPSLPLKWVASRDPYEVRARRTLMCLERIGRLGFWHGRQRMSHEQRPNCRGFREALGTGYNRVGGIGRAS